MYLLATLLNISDFLWAPFSFLLLYMFFSFWIRKYKEEKIRRLFMKAFLFKMACALFYTLLTNYYYGGADTEMYFYCVKHLHQAVMDDQDNFFTIYKSSSISSESPLAGYFLNTESPYPDYEAMHDPGNFWVPKFALPFALIFNLSYLAVAFVFSFFALGGAIRLYKFFYHYFPRFQKEIAVATLFLPSVAYWSSGVLKDSICFGAVGYIVYGVFNIFVKRRHLFTSLLWIILSVYLVYTIKVYILLALIPGIVLWLFTEYNRVVQSKTLRQVLTGITVIIGALIALWVVSYTTSDESLKKYSFDNIAETSAKSRDQYQDYGTQYQGSYYKIGTTNPVLIFLNGIGATFFRPFLWEVNGITALFSALESLFFLYITLVLIYRRGFINFFRKAFSKPILMMCFVFAIIFAAAVGSTALNFGSLSRYKIPCLPFYLLMVLIMYREAGLTYPGWFNKLLGYNISGKKTNTKPF